MKSFLFSFLIFFISFTSLGQETFIISAVDEAPFIKECYDPNKDTKECFNQNLSDHVKSNLVTPKTLKGEGKAYATFQVSEKGKIEEIKVKATDEDQKAEVIRVLSEIRILEPAKVKGKAVAMSYAMPIIFKQEMFDSYASYFETRAKDLPHARSTAFPPHVAACASKDDKFQCFSNSIENMIRENVAAKPGGVLNLSFEIDKEAKLQNVTVLSHNDQNASKQAKSFLEQLSLKGPARNEQKQPVKSYYYERLVF
ncbi:energy transducer TonB [Salinimicrobium oceani]|uniref:TonB protein C-terminal n=1 Tax=Salinimicrobium oceani TaxID=2722702 RepID=A0ABX1CZ49_9FLAO|nr:energy transducer TonB [Salinimicrobium oceani]NJW52397.1 hypothetical protein [Salinimicrobium oceani]